MPRTGRNRKTKREHRNEPYYYTTCTRCSRELRMRKGRKTKCPICDGNGGKKEQRASRFTGVERKVIADVSASIVGTTSSVESK